MSAFSRQTWFVIAACWCTRAALGLLVGAPFAVAVGAVVGNFPSGDSVVFQEGGVLMAELGRHLDPVWRRLSWRSLGRAAAGSLLWLLLVAAMVARVCRPDRSPWKVAASRYGALLGLQLAVMFLQGLCLVAIAWVGGQMVSSAAEHLLHRPVVGCLLSACLLLAALSLFQDVVRLHLVRTGQGLAESVSRVLDVPRARWGRLVGMAAAHGLGAALVSLLIGYAAISRGLMQGGWLLWFLVQAQTLAFVLVRFSWLLRAERCLRGEAPLMGLNPP